MIHYISFTIIPHHHVLFFTIYFMFIITPIIPVDFHHIY